MAGIVALAYCSRPVGFSFDKVNDFLESSRRRNTEDDITGALIYDNRYFLQWLEGGKTEIRNTFGRIAKDPRHHDIKLLTVRKLTGRWFPDWSMTAVVTEDQTLRSLKLVPHLSLNRFDPFQWSEDDVTRFMEALSDYFTRRPAPKSESAPKPDTPRPTRIDPATMLDHHLSGIA